MNQRYDLLAVCLLMFAAVFSVWISLMPIDLTTVSKWQTLIGGIITGSGILVASWNVTRQMRLAARGREQDRIERELPGLREGIFLLARFSVAIGKRPIAKSILDEFEALGLQQPKAADFLASVVESLPLTPDFTKREIAIELGRLRAFTRQFAARGTALSNAERAHRIAEAAGHNNLVEQIANVTAERADYDAAKEKFDKAVADFESYLTKLKERVQSEVRKGEMLRREHDRSLALR